MIPRLKFAQSVVLLQVISYALFLVKVCIYMDPLGFSTPGLLEKLKILDKSDTRGSWLEVSGEVDSSVDALHRRACAEPLSVAPEVNIWRKNRRFGLGGDQDISKVTKIHNDSISMQKYERRLRAVFCCLGVQGHRSRGAALEDIARGLYTVFSETDVSLSDVIAGFSLLRQHQQKKKRKEGDIALTKKFRKV